MDVRKGRERKEKVRESNGGRRTEGGWGGGGGGGVRE